MSEPVKVPEDPYGPEAHDLGWPQHSKKRGHYCEEWDGLWICEDCSEFKHCSCLIVENAEHLWIDWCAQRGCNGMLEPPPGTDDGRMFMGTPIKDLKATFMANLAAHAAWHDRHRRR